MVTWIATILVTFTGIAIFVTEKLVALISGSNNTKVNVSRSKSVSAYSLTMNAGHFPISVIGLRKWLFLPFFSLVCQQIYGFQENIQNLQIDMKTSTTSPDC